MNKILSSVAMAIALLTAASAAADGNKRADVNFAFGGATTTDANATNGVPELAPILAMLEANGLELIGLEQQLDYAALTLDDVDTGNGNGNGNGLGEHKTKDVFWVYAGTNDYILGLLTGAFPAPAAVAANVRSALERLYAEVGARRFVVPNLPDLGALPFVTQNPAIPPAVAGLFTGLTVGHNASLAQELADFRAAHPDTQVVTADVFSLFKAREASPLYTNTTEACSVVQAAEDLTDPATCAGFFYLDAVHPSSSAWEPVAAAIAAGLGGNRAQVQRIITLGDSFSDLGSQSDTLARGLPFPFTLTPPPFTEGRFTEGANVVQQTEALLRTQVRSTFFAQPRSFETVVVGVDEATTDFDGVVGTRLERTGYLIIPSEITAQVSEAGPACSVLTLAFGDGNYCWYEPGAGGTHVNTGCTAFTGLAAGSRVEAEAVKIIAGDSTQRYPEYCGLESATVVWPAY